MKSSVAPAVALVAVVATPLLLPMAALLRRPAGFAALLEAPRLATLAGNTLALAVGAVLIAVPGGTLAALAIERGHVPGRGALRALVLFGAFVPLTVYAAGWQAALGAVALPDAGGWRPWRSGLLPAIWVHAVAGVPWVAGFVALALRTTDPQLEDDARLAGGSPAVWRGVLWPRTRVAATGGAGWVAVQALTESAVTDLFMLRTFAEEVYFQLVGNPAGVAAAVAITLPVWALAVACAAVVLTRASRVATGSHSARPPIGPAGRASLLLSAVIWLLAFTLVAVPIAGLVVRASGLGTLLAVAGAHGFVLLESVWWAGVAGALAAAPALAACWRARDSRRWRLGLVGLVSVAWVTPAPLVGLGLKALIGYAVACEDAVVGRDAAFAPVRSLLYDQPSPLPGVWAAVVRFFPLAVAVLWPAVRGVPRELIDAATLEGGRRAVWHAAVWPGVRRSFATAVAAVGLLTLGEVVATKLVQPPGWRTFAGDLFDAMHYGADATVAAMCLLQVVATAGACALFCTLRR